MKSIVILALVAVATCCSLAAARPAIATDDDLQSPLNDGNVKQSPFMQPMFFNDEKGSLKLLARPIGFIPIFMLSNPKRLPSQQQLGSDVQKSAMPRNLNLDIATPSSDTVQKISMYPSLSETDTSQINTNPSVMENEEGVLPPKMDEPLSSSIPASESVKPLEDPTKEDMLRQNGELPIQQRAKRQFRPYPYHRPYGYPYGYDYDDSSDYDISIDVDVVRDDFMPGYPGYFRPHHF